LAIKFRPPRHKLPFEIQPKKIRRDEVCFHSLSARFLCPRSWPMLTGRTTISLTTTYFSSPIRTLCESIKDSERQFQFISSHVKDDIAGLHPPAFLSIFKDNSTLLVQRMSRDLRGVVANPFGSRLRYEELSMNQSYDLDCSPDEENLLDATNHTLCQYALRLLSDIFIHPSLYSTLSRSCTS